MDKDDRLPDTSGLTALQLREMINSIREQPAWRLEADRCCQFYDGNQLTVDERQEYERRGVEPVVINQVKPLVNAVLGLEAKTRTDWRVVADNDEQQELAEALSEKLFEAERETMADYACSEAFASQIKAGVGWVEVSRNSNPFEYPYRVEAVNRDEIWWDWAARKLDLSDARYFIRKREFAVDTVLAYYPKEADVIRAAATGWGPEWLDLVQNDVRLQRAYETEVQSGWSPADWRSENGKLVWLYEVWYRVPVKTTVINLPDGRTVELDKKNPIHALAVEEGFASPREAVIPRLRVSLWAGPHKLHDEDHGSNHLPYIPFWGYREDRTRAPYGVVRDLIPLQKEVNARRSKMQWLLATKRVIADSDALDQSFNDFNDLQDEAARSDALIVTNPNRRNANGITISSDLSLAGQQFQVMQDAGDQMQRVAGIFNSMLGATDGAKSGTAINSLVEQGNTMQAEITDNYRFARRIVGQRLLELIVEDMMGVEMTILVGEEGRQKAVAINQVAIDETTGLQYRVNDVSKALVKVALHDIPSTPAYRAQAMTMLAEVIKGLPPQLQSAMVPYYLESTDLPKRQEMADLARKVLGIGGPEDEQPDPEKQQMMQAIEQMQQMMQEGAAAYEAQLAELQKKLEMAQIKVANKEGELALAAAEEERLSEAAQVSNAERLANIDRIMAEVQRIRAATVAQAANLNQPTPPAQMPPRIPAPRVGGDPGL